MARKRRIEREDAIYHIMNRGNYRRSIFETVGARKAFQKALFEAMIRFDWELYGYTIMWNHFHLALRTPRGGLSKGQNRNRNRHRNRLKFRNNRIFSLRADVVRRGRCVVAGQVDFDLEGKSDFWIPMVFEKRGGVKTWLAMRLPL